MMSDFLSHETYLEVRSVLEQADRPRAVLQAYNAFLHRWVVVRLQGSEKKFHPRLLALLLLLQYAWPDVFRQIRDNPYYFFYLHALATGFQNNFCDLVEIAEIRELGLPAKAKNSPLYNYRKPGLVNLLKNWKFGDDFDLVSGRNRLSQHLTLDETGLDPIPLYQETQVWEALNSGDPAQIKLVAFYEEGKIASDYERPLRDLIIDLNKDIEFNGDKAIEAINHAEAVIFALGLIGNGGSRETFDVLTEILIGIPVLPTTLRLRAIYALGHLERSARKQNIQQEHQLFSALVKGILLDQNEKQGQRVRVGLANHVQYGSMQDTELIKLWELLYQDRDENVVVRRTLIESLKNASWRERALKLLTVEGANKLPSTDLIEICGIDRWPRDFGQLFIQRTQEANNNALRESVFTLLQGFREKPGKTQTPQDKAQIIEWMGELLQNIGASGIGPEEDKEFRGKCWAKISELQKDRDVPWQETTWELLFKFSLAIADNLIVGALKKTTGRLEAKPILEALLVRAPVDWRNDIEDALAEF